MILPVGFENRMREMLGEEFDLYIKSYEEDKAQALRVNTLKLSPERFCELVKEGKDFGLENVPWVKEGFYYDPQTRPGKHPYHEMGLYYIQEPSAMSVAALAGVKEGERVLDLCAAPGGKSTQLAAALGGKGVLVSNEIHPARAKILSQNIERMGIKNAIVTNETPAHLAQFFQGFFDRIVVDAPCSGEGMFKKEEQALEHWSLENVELCAGRQKEIIDAAVTMLRPGGVLVYSTCTFAPAENEGSIQYILDNYKEFTIEKSEWAKYFEPGRPEWISGDESLRDTMRLWPHKLRGEGHFVAVLKKAGEGVSSDVAPIKKPVDKTILKLYKEFAKDVLSDVPTGNETMFGDNLYIMPIDMELKGLKVLRAGLHVGTVKKNRFEPSHALALAMNMKDIKNVVELSSEDPAVEGYLKGNTVSCEGKNGWNVLCVDGYPIGWGKYNNGVLKNHYPKGLRWM